MVFSNGYVVEVEGRMFGPYLKYDDAVEAHKGEDAAIKSLNHKPTSVKVFDCDTVWCKHCKIVEKEN